MKGSLAKVLTDNTGDLGEISGLMSRLFGYDRTMKGSGLRSLMNQTFNLDGKDVAVITAHRGAKEARLVYNDLVKMVEQELEGRLMVCSVWRRPGYGYNEMEGRDRWEKGNPVKATKLSGLN